MRKGEDVQDERKDRFRSIFEEHAGSVLSYALRRVDSPDEAKDVVSETFLVAWRRLDSIPEPPLPWLLGTARRVLANQRRAAGNRVHLVAKLSREAESDVAAEPADERASASAKRCHGCRRPITNRWPLSTGRA